MSRLNGGGQDLTAQQRTEHTMQNMSSILDQVNEDHREATKNQFKVFGFCAAIKKGEFDFDIA